METHDRRRVRALVEAGGRALTLVGVVGLITVDYKFLQFKSSLSSILSQKEDESNKRIKYAEQALLEADATAKAAEMRLAQLTRISTRANNSNREAAESEARATMRIAAEAAEALVKARKDAEHSAASQHVQQILDAHQRAANRLLWLARTNKGVYIKLAQHLAQLDYLVPDEYTRTLRVCLDNAPQSSYEDVCHVITDEFGAPPQDLFHSFERIPIASASLAQVHVAYLPDSRGQRGLKCAVKVQHRGLRETATGDVEAVSAVVKLVSRAFPDMPLWWVAEEIAPNLPIELDFCQEANHAERCRQLYANDERVRVPHVLPHLSSKRVLTMSFEDGCSITDVEAIRAMNLSTQAVAELLAETFNRQMYQAGFVHCDPHPANVLVRALPSRRSSAWLPDRMRSRRQPQLVLLDHGLYRDLDTHFTKEYCILWRALVLGDVQVLSLFALLVLY
jgi:aarF domain-containing kinase